MSFCSRACVLFCLLAAVLTRTHASVAQPQASEPASQLGVQKNKKEMDIKDAVKASVAAESEDSKLWGFVPNWFRTTIGPLFLVLTPPYFVVLFWHLMVNLDGSVSWLWTDLRATGVQYLIDIVPSPVDPQAWKYILAFG